MQAALCAKGIRVSRKRVARLMRTAGLRGCEARRKPRTTVSDPTATPAPNLVQRQFDVGELDRVWVTDITYLPTAEGWLYLAALLDACSRRVVGWAMADHLRTGLVLEALAMALRERRPRAGKLVHHSDRGCQYTADAYQTVLAAHEIRCSMSRTGNCLDTAMAESGGATLKKELLPDGGWPTKAAARAAVFEWIAVFYNRQRLHSSLGYRTPLSFEISKGHAMAASRLLVYQTGSGLGPGSCLDKITDRLARSNSRTTDIVPHSPCMALAGTLHYKELTLEE